MNKDTSTESTVYLLYDGECPFCTKAAQYHQLKKAFPSLLLISLRDIDQLKMLNLPKDLNPNNGMVLILPGELPLQGREAFIALNNVLGAKSLFHRALSIRLLATVIYPCLMFFRRIALLVSGSSANMQKV